jgi:GNAT superfamily N-acetyltransferase
VSDATLRAAREDEAETLMRIQAEASIAALAHVFPPDRYPYPFDAIRENWQRALAADDEHVIVAEVEDRPVGVAAAKADWLDGLYVVPDRWGTGVAAALHDRARELAVELGSVEWNLWVLEHNGRARRFYERRGWRENGTTRVVPFPPHPLDVGYTLSPEGGRTLAPG